ncbi:MAG TPA: septal ring lytic transglycosylase RlpA family protein [Terrimicrobiaceae bacterium]|nr:septal ring lytic transglycosylase RlpA family protein [Terrimicrobiaceae bacterium]
MRRKLILLLLLPLAACSTVERVTEPGGHVALYDPKPVHVETGIASWYRDHRTASGERFDTHALAGAHKKLPFGTKVRVVDLKTNKSIIIRINDRGPYIRGRVVDLTVGAARQLGMYDRGICKVRLEVLREIPLLKKPNIHVDAAAKKKDDARSAQPKAKSPPR